MPIGANFKRCVHCEVLLQTLTLTLAGGRIQLGVFQAVHCEVLLPSPQPTERRVVPKVRDRVRVRARGLGLGLGGEAGLHARLQAAQQQSAELRAWLESAAAAHLAQEPRWAG